MPRINGGKFPDADGAFSKAPNFNFNDKMKFGTNDVSNANDNFGSVSGFLPKSLLSPKGVLVMPFVLSIRCANPAAKHPTYLIYDFLKDNVFFRIKCSSFFHETDKKA